MLKKACEAKNYYFSLSISNSQNEERNNISFFSVRSLAKYCGGKCGEILKEINLKI